MKENEEKAYGEKIEEKIESKIKAEEDGEVIADKDFEFMKEKIKERPINRKKLVRRTVITASMAVVFGLIACVTFLVLEPVFSNWLYPEEEPKPITFPEVEEEILPEDMIQEDSQIHQIEDLGAVGLQPEEQPVTEKKELQVEDYQLLYNKLYKIAQNNEKSMVKVTGVTSDVDWFNNTYENKEQTSGLIVADNGKNYLILVEKETVEEAESIQVTFFGGEQVTATILATDPSVGLTIISVPLESLTEDSRKGIAPATLGNSNMKSLAGTPVVAVGSPMGTTDSIVYGMLTSIENPVNVVDNAYRLMTTDMYGSLKAGGVLLDMKGQVIGIIDMSHNDENTENLISAIGITEVKKTMEEKLLKGQQMAYLGIYGTDVTEEANEKLKVPFGAYVTEIVMDSPAMLTGIQRGDVIVKIGNTEVTDFNTYINAMFESNPGAETTITIMRQGKENYQEMSFDITMGALK